MPLNWSDWKNIKEVTNYTESAIYRIRILVNGKPYAIGRFLGEDISGLLYIGKASNMENRRYKFARVLIRNKGRHTAGILLKIVEKVTQINSLLPFREYQFSFAKVLKAEEDKWEEKLIKEYFMKYGEVPPLNSAIPKRRVEW